MYLGTEGCCLTINGRMQEQLLHYPLLTNWQSCHKPLLSHWYIHANIQECTQYLVVYMFYAFNENRFNFV